MDLLRCENLEKSFGGVRALQGVSLRVKEGEITGVVGTNGAGKSTLFHLLTGFLKPDKGNIRLFTRGKWERVEGKPPYRMAAMGIGRTFQTVRLFEEFTLWENIRLMERRPGWGWELLRESGLEGRAHCLPALLSCYEARVGELLRALATGPRLVFLDEPAAGMNGQETEQFGRLLERLRISWGFTPVLIEHDMDLVFRLCSTLYVMDGGKVAAAGSPRELWQNPQVRELLWGEE